MGKQFIVEIRKSCKMCGSVLPKRFRTYCSKTCRQKAINERHRPYQKQWQRDKRGEKAPHKLRCGICGKWYVQVGSHTVQLHKLTGREYREYLGLPVKRGVVPTWYRNLKGNQAIENGTVENLKTGKRHRYKKNDPRSKQKLFWKSHRREPDDYYE